MKKIFLLIFSCYFIFFLLIPPFQAPDEPEHFENIYWVSQMNYPFRPTSYNVRQNVLYAANLTKLYDSGGITQDFIIPNFQKIEASGLRKQTDLPVSEKAKLTKRSAQSYHPPVYYVFGAVFFNITKLLNFDLVSQFYFVRLTSSMFYFGIVFLAYKILKLLLKDKSSYSRLLIFFSLNPLLISMGVGINPDIGVTFFSLLFFHRLIIVDQDKNTRVYRIVLLGILSALAALTKFSGIFTVLVFLIWILKKFGFNKRNFYNIFLFLLTWITITFPWFLFNFSRYGVPIIENFSIVVPQPLQPVGVFQSVIQSILEFRHTFMHYAGFLGWNETHPFKWFYSGYFFVFLLLFVIGSLSLIKSKDRFFRLNLIFVFSLLVFLFVLGFDFKHKGVPWDLQGRYLLPVFMSVSLVLLSGAKTVFKKNLNQTANLMSVWAILHYNLILFFVLLPKYYV